MSNIYFYHLEDMAKNRYLEKLEYNGVALPDPLDTELRLRLYKSRYPKISPNITFGDIYIYLVETEHSYTREEFKNYKNLDCYEMILNKKVRDILAYKCDNTQMCVLTCDVESGEIVVKLYRAWAVIALDGVIQNGHCTCMKGLENACCHVAALLLSLEIAVKKDGMHKNSGASYTEDETSIDQNRITASEYFETGKKNVSTVSNSYNSVSSLSTKKKCKDNLQAIKKIAPNAPIFTLLSDSDFSSEEEENNDYIEDGCF